MLWKLTLLAGTCLLFFIFLFFTPMGTSLETICACTPTPSGTPRATFEERINGAATIFEGTVVDRRLMGEQNIPQLVGVEVQVSRYLKGSGAEAVIVTGWGDSAQCLIAPPAIGGSFIFYTGAISPDQIARADYFRAESPISILDNATADRILGITGQEALLPSAVSSEAIATLQAIGTLTPLSSLALSPDGQMLITGSWSGIARLWDTRDQQLLLTLTHGDRILDVAFSPDNQTVITAGENAYLWDAATGEQLLTLEHADIRTVNFSPDGQFIITGHGDGTATVWNTSDGESVLTLGHEEAVWAAVFAPDGQVILTGGLDRTVKLWAAETGSLISSINAGDDILTAAFSPDGQTFVTGGSSGKIQVWDRQSGMLINTLQEFGVGVWTVIFSPDGATILAGGSDWKTSVWDVPTGEVMFTLAGHTDVVRGAAFSQDGSLIYTASLDSLIKRWDAHTGEFLGNLPGN